MSRTAGRPAAQARLAALPVPAAVAQRLANWYHRLKPAPRIEDWARPLTAPTASPPRVPRDQPARQGRFDAGLQDATPPADRPDQPMLRCLIVTTMFDTGGLQEVAGFLARQLQPFGMHTAVLDVRPHPSPDGQPSGYLGRMLQSWGLEVKESGAAGAADWIRRWNPDVISAHGVLPGGVADAAHRLGVPYVETLHGMHDFFGADWRAETARSAKLSAILAVSELVRRQYLTGNRSFPPGRVVTIPNGVDGERRPVGDRAAARDRLGLSGEYLFVSLSRHCLQKNSYGLVAAFGELARHRPGAHLVLAGKPGDPRYLRRILGLREKLACRQRIHVRDHLATPARLLDAADGFVLDSFFEGWPLASMEAMCSGLPVVLSDVGGAREQVGDDTSRGYLVANPLGDPLHVNWETMRSARYQEQVNRDELITAMDRLISARDTYGSNRRELAAESAARFSGSACAARHAAVLRAVAADAELPGSDVGAAR